ncbi:MAG: HD-GYP domain-containing protein [Chitinivibrionia bacterium]|nr:HD-GYP domain-containing protein [Chitinivibrionia bacterium]
MKPSFPASIAADCSIMNDDIFLPGPARQIERLGPLLVYCLFSAGRTVRIHDVNNRAAQAALAKLGQTLDECARLEGRVAIASVSDVLLINDVRIIVDSQSMGPLLYLIDEMKKRKVEEIDFGPDVTLPELGSFLKLFFLEPAEEDVFGEVNRRLSEAGIVNIRLTEWIEREKFLRDAKEERREIREESNKVMSRAVMFMGEVLRSIEQRRPIQLPKAHRLTQQMADIIQTDETILVGLSSIKDYDEYTFSHSVNVSVLSMLISDRMGLHKNDTAQIGVAALLHDIGKTHIPQSILNKPARLNTDEWSLMKRHSMLGAIELSRVRSLRAVVDPIFVSLQHHLLYNGSGYPVKPGAWELHPYTHIIVIADIYDAMTTPRIYRERTLTPDRVLRYILHKSGEMFDPLVVKVFIKTMGLYPVGTVVELDTGERAVVLRQNDRTSFLHRPVVSLLREDGSHSEPIDLAAPADGGTSCRRSIAGSVQDADCEARKARCFVMK